MKRILFLAAGFCFFVFGQASAQLETGTLKVASSDGEFEYAIEIADEAEEIRTGLMFRESLGDDSAMLFDFGEVRPASMWMKNTLIPLDMLFIAPDGEIVAIAHNAVPGSLRSLGPGVPVAGVLEINGGQAEARGILPGDTVVHTMFGNAGR